MDGGRAVARLHDEIASLSEREGDETQQVPIVIRDQNLHSVFSTGSVTLKRVRPSAVRTAVISPPWRSTMDLTIHNPRPSPPGSGSMSLPRRNCSKMELPVPSGRPGPSSSTHVMT